jgi:putative ABC transport system ATP-binding protein
MLRVIRERQHRRRILSAAAVVSNRIHISMTPVVQIKDLQRVYDSGEVKVHAVRGVSLDLHRGEFLAIMGASGSGKSTLMNTLGCLDRPTSGSYLLDGIDVLKLDRNALADLRNEKLGFVFQGFNLLSRTTALENVELPMLYGKHRGSGKQLRERALQVLDIVGLSQRADHFPSQLSGGQQQRVAIARALVNDPQVILADEPTGNLDSKTSVEVMGVFQKLNDRGITIVMVTHELDIARFCKRNVIMRDGRIVSDIQVTDRSRAEIELQKLHAAETDAKLIGQD